MDWISILQVIGGIISGIGIGFFTKSGRVKAKADVFGAGLSICSSFSDSKDKEV